MHANLRVAEWCHTFGAWVVVNGLWHTRRYSLVLPEAKSSSSLQLVYQWVTLYGCGFILGLATAHVQRPSCGI